MTRAERLLWVSVGSMLAVAVQVGCAAATILLAERAPKFDEF